MNDALWFDSTVRRKKKGRQESVTTCVIKVVTMVLLLHCKCTCPVEGFGSMLTTYLIYISDWYSLVSSVARCKLFLNATVCPLLHSQWCSSDPRPAVEVRTPAWAPAPRPFFLTCMKEMMEHLMRNQLIPLSLQKFRDQTFSNTLQ